MLFVKKVNVGCRFGTKKQETDPEVVGHMGIALEPRRFTSSELEQGMSAPGEIVSMLDLFSTPGFAFQPGGTMPAAMASASYPGTVHGATMGQAAAASSGGTP